MTVTYQIEDFVDVYDEAIPLLQDHYEEIATIKDISPLEPDYDKYLAMDKAGMIRIMTARDGWDLVGYFVTFVHPSLHYRSLTYGVNDIVYIKPGYRGSTVGHRLFKIAMDDLKNSCGVGVLYVHMRVNHEFRSLLVKLGFVQTEENWEARL